MAEVPKLQPFNFPPTVKPGSRVSAMCSITSGGSQVTLSWLKDGKDISNVKNVVVDTKRGASLIFVEPVEISNAGNYTCIAKNREGFDSFTAFLDVQAPPSWKKKAEDVRVNIGDRVIIECLATGSPIPKIRWRKRTQDLAPSSSVKIYNNGTLALEDVTRNDGGDYSCEADNGMAPSATLEFSVTVNGETYATGLASCNQNTERYTTSRDIVLQPFTFPSDVKPGSRVSTFCLTSSGGSEVALSWLKDGRDVGDTKNVFVETNKGLSTILIDPVDISNAGNYTCIAKNRAGFDSFTAILDVEAPPFFKKTSPDTDVVQGSSVTLTCHATGSPQPRIEW
ncbi:unnamed protein product, partial [Ixodes persulcatus]